MKKFIIFLSVFALLLSCVVVPVFAEDNSQVTFNSNPDWASLKAIGEYREIQTVKGYYVSLHFAMTENGNTKVYDGILVTDDLMAFYCPQNGSKLVYYNGWNNSLYRDIAVLTTPSMDVQRWLADNTDGWVFEEVKCDGSTCHVADYNVDGVCDTCGNVLSAAAYGRLYTPTNWPSYLPSPPLGFDEGSDYIVTSNTDGTIKLFVWTPINSYANFEWRNRIALSMQYIRIQSWDGDNPAYMAFYEYSYSGATEQWTSVSSSQSQNSTTIGTVANTSIIYSTLDIYYEDGTPFFPRPLTGAVQEVIREEVQAARLKVVQTMKTLTIAGLGLLALLMGFHLLHKKLRIFLP